MAGHLQVFQIFQAKKFFSEPQSGAKLETTVHNCAFTFTSLKPLDSYNNTSGHFQLFMGHKTRFLFIFFASKDDLNPNRNVVFST